MARRGLCLFAAIGISFLAVAQSVNIPFAAKAPVIDGMAATGEWNEALHIVGAGKPVDARRAEIAFSWDAE